MTEKLKKPSAVVLPLDNYTMAYNPITPHYEWRRDRSRYSDCRDAVTVYSYSPLAPWPSGSYFEKFKPDAALLEEAIYPDPLPRDATLAEQVFGSQARQQRIGLRHLANVLHERALFHRRHLQDIDRRLVDCQDRLSILKMHLPLDGGRAQQHLEKLVIELEKQRHDEEISFWKDSTEIRQQLFESAATYGSAQRRQDMLDGVEADGI